MPLLTRRAWAMLLAALPLVAQAPSPQPAPPAPMSAADEVRNVSRQLAAIEIPMAVEPAFAFHA